MVLTADGKQVPIVMGSYGIGIERIASSAVELYHDEDGIVWPVSIAPFTVILTPVNYRDAVKEVADMLYGELQKSGLDVLLDDRQERPGVKFKDADLVGIPYRIVLGAEKVSRGKAEIFERATRETGTVDIGSVVSVLQARLKGTKQF
jgi:prolyl-tRNA synthetase